MNAEQIVHATEFQLISSLYVVSFSFILSCIMEFYLKFSCCFEKMYIERKYGIESDKHLEVSPKLI